MGGLTEDSIEENNNNRWVVQTGTQLMAVQCMNE